MKKRLLSVLVVFAMLVGAVSAVRAESLSEFIEEQLSAGEVQAYEAYKEIEAPQQGFKTQCLERYSACWTNDGLYINLREASELPGVLVYRYYNETRDPATHLQQVIKPVMQDLFGENIASVTDPMQYEVGGYNASIMAFMLRQGDFVMQIHRLEIQTGNDIIDFAAAFQQDDFREVLTAVEAAVKGFAYTDGTMTGTVPAPAPLPGPQTAPVPSESGIEITPSEVSQVRYVDYTDPAGWFSMKIPEGWKIQIGTAPDYQMEFVGFTIKIYDPDCPERTGVWQLCGWGMPNSKVSSDFWKNTYPSSVTAQMPYPKELTPRGVFEALAGYRTSGYDTFDVKETVGTTPIGGEMYFAECTSSATGKEAEGLFQMAILNIPNYVFANPMDIWSFEKIDVGVLMSFDTVEIMAPKGEFADWYPVIRNSLGSIQFSDGFYQLRKQEWANIIKSVNYISNTASAISDMIMDTWENQSHTYEVNSQKQSDATLGYERVYDTETGEYYKAEVGFGDWYTGERYQVVDTDEAYLSPVSGTINWK